MAGFLASCGLGNLKKLILSLYTELKTYDNILYKPEPIEYINNPLKCDGDIKFTKLFYGQYTGTGTGTERQLTIQNNIENKDNEEKIKIIIDGYYEKYLKELYKYAETPRKNDDSTYTKYEEFLEFIISQWYKNHCDTYNIKNQKNQNTQNNQNNQDFMLYNFGYIWLLKIRTLISVVELDLKISDQYDNLDA